MHNFAHALTVGYRGATGAGPRGSAPGTPRSPRTPRTSRTPRIRPHASSLVAMSFSGGGVSERREGVGVRAVTLAQTAPASERAWFHAWARCHGCWPDGFCPPRASETSRASPTVRTCGVCDGCSGGLASAEVVAAVRVAGPGQRLLPGTTYFKDHVP